MSPQEKHPENVVDIWERFHRPENQNPGGIPVMAILKEDLEQIREVWEYCGFPITDEEIFKIAEEVSGNFHARQ